MSRRYLIPKARARAEIRVSNSRFVTTVDRADTVRAAQDIVRAIRAEWPDATHHVYAFKIGFAGTVSEGLSDDGEPSGTAGPPTMAVLRGAEIGDVVLVTTRYFGGTKLGTGGLVAAYTEAAKAGLAAVETMPKVTRKRFRVTIPYPTFEAARRMVHGLEGTIENESFGDAVALEVAVPEEAIPALVQQFADLTAGRSAPEPLD